MTELRISVTYCTGHSFSEPWESTDYFCPICGQRKVWARRDGGDYYVGEKYLCSVCGDSWDWPNEPHEDRSPEEQQRLERLRKA